jgi:hypothetical protein
MARELVYACLEGEGAGPEPVLLGRDGGNGLAQPPTDKNQSGIVK